MRSASRLGVFGALALLTGQTAVGDRAAVVIGNPADLQVALQALGQGGVRRAGLDELAQESRGERSLALCSMAYPQPTRLSAAQAEALERFVAEGGRAYVEYAVRDDGKPLFGVEVAPEVRRALHQRLFVSEGLHPISGLKPGDILEEHNSACLAPKKLPEGARTVLKYGLVLGTYAVMEREAGYSVTVDLGEVRTLSAVSQRYGAGQPNYYPERVELWLGEDPDRLQRAGAVEQTPESPVVRFDLEGTRARYVRLVLSKYRRSPVTDFLFVGEIEALDERGVNVALHRPYALTPTPNSTYGDAGGELTDGVVDGGYADGLSVGWVTEPVERWEQWPALVEAPWGKGTALIAFTKLSDFRAREYRLTGRWEGLLCHVALFLTASGEREEAARYVPLRCWTEPRVWAPPGEPVTLHVESAEGAEVSVRTDGGQRVEVRQAASGRYVGPVRLPDGEHAITVVAQTPRGRAEQTVRLSVLDREAAYRRALDRNMRWFERSGVLPRADGSAGVWSQRCLAWFDGGPDEWLASPFRVDCNAATAQALYLYGELTQSDRWRGIAVNVARSTLPHQYLDPDRASFGGWPWLYEKDEAIYFWDDNTRVAVALLWLYTQTGEEEFLRAGLRTMELCREVAQPDGLIARHVIAASELDRIGREGFRRLPPQGLAVDFDLKRWGWAYGVTGDAAYGELLRQAAEVWGSEASPRGLPFAVRAGAGSVLAARLREQWHSYLKDPCVQRYGVPLAGPGDYQQAFVGDCSITTTADDPLTDQLYCTPHLLLQAWWGYCATKEDVCLEAFRRIGDYLVRIQFESKDPRIDGAWMRGFDVENWEVYGAPYDPAYGPYSAYTGWMNAFAATAFAQYLLRADALPPPTPPGGRVPAVLAETRTERSPGQSPANIARGATYQFNRTPTAPYDDEGGELTDGVLDGPYADGRSVGWHLAEGETLRLEVMLDLGIERPVAAVAQRYGAGRGGYLPDSIEVWCGAEPGRMERVAEVGREGAGPGRRFIALASAVRARSVRLVVTKRRVSPTTDFLFVGETEVFEEL